MTTMTTMTTMTHANYDRFCPIRDTETYLAVYMGPGGPISFTIEAEGLGHAKRLADLVGKGKYDEGADELGLEPDASDEDVEAALGEQGWELVLTGDHGHDWFIYQRA